MTSPSPNPTRWAGVPLAERRSERRTLLVDAAFDIFGTLGEAGLSVRSVCRACDLHTRYFYESFVDTDELLGAVYDKIAGELGEAVADAISTADTSVRERTALGIRTVLAFGSADPRRGRVLFTEARANPVLAARRAITQDLLREVTSAETTQRDPDPLAGRIAAAIFTGAMAELAQQWLLGHLGEDLDAVVERTIPLVLPASQQSAR